MQNGYCSRRFPQRQTAVGGGGWRTVPEFSAASLAESASLLTLDASPTGVLRPFSALSPSITAAIRAFIVALHTKSRTTPGSTKDWLRLGSPYYLNKWRSALVC